MDIKTEKAQKKEWDDNIAHFHINFVFSRNFVLNLCVGLLESD